MSPRTPYPKSRIVCAALLLALAAGCSGPTSSRKSAAGRKAGSSIAGSTLEGYARRGRADATKVRKYLAAAEAYLLEGSATSAIRCAHEARRLTSSRQLQAQSDYLLGKAHLGQLKLSLAERYLEKSLGGLKGFGLEESRAHLVVCLRIQNKSAEAEAVLKRLKEPAHPHIQAILTTPRPRLADQKPPKAPAIARIGSLPAKPSTTGNRQLPHLQVLARSNWKAKSTIKSRTTPQPLSKIFRMTIHHSGEPAGISTTSKWGTSREILRIQRYHQREKGWADIGYHYIVDRAGRVWQGRPVSYQGAHARGDANRGNIGIVVLGNYSTGKQLLNKAQRDGLKLLVLKLGQYFSIPSTRLYTHAEILPGHTHCPGPKLTAYARTLRAELKRHQLAGAQLTSSARRR
jgi:hypothetical protein